MSLSVALLPELDLEFASLRKCLERLPGGTVFVAMPRMAVLRGMVMYHLVHHRGQLSVYMRTLEIPVPSIYGPSADEGNR